MPIWQTTRFRIDLARPQVMGIVNVTPDSFSDGGRHMTAQDAIAHCERLVREGADILDIGGESTRPGAPVLSASDEWGRLQPVLEAVVGFGVPISVDTSKPEVIARALALGVDIINDVRALQVPGALTALAQHPSCGVCLMHMQGQPQNMQSGNLQYEDVVSEVARFLQERIDALREQGVGPDRITLDPGIGFGKTPDHNIALLKRQRELLSLGLPLLVGWSRKSTLGHITGQDVDQRLAASLAAALAGVSHGAKVVRVHDVRQTRDALAVWAAAGLLS